MSRSTEDLGIPERTSLRELVCALYRTRDSLPDHAGLDEWCSVIRDAFTVSGLQVFCHKSAKSALKVPANARYHCDVQHDIAKLNRDTRDPSEADTDRAFPHDALWVFRNGTREDGYDYSEKFLDKAQLERAFRIESIRALVEKTPPVLVEVRFPGCATSPDWHLCQDEEELDEILGRLGRGAEVRASSVWDLKNPKGDIRLTM